jgi:uncharacterized protein
MVPVDLRAIAFRLLPGQDLRVELDALVQQNQWPAACVLTCVGSLTEANLRLAGHPEGTIYQGPFEIVSLTGVMGVGGSHYHVAIADSNGQTIGGHLLQGCCIHTTAELVIGIMPALRFTREPCPLSGYSELKIDNR